MARAARRSRACLCCRNPVTGSGGRRQTNHSDSGAIPTCSPDRRSPVGHLDRPGHRPHFLYIFQGGGRAAALFSRCCSDSAGGITHRLRSPVSGRFPLLVFFQEPINARRSPAPLHLQQVRRERRAPAAHRCCRSG